MPIRRTGRGSLPAIVVVLAVMVIALHVVVNATTAYGIHRDELLYMSMGRHLRLWQMDFPPMIALVSQASRTFGNSLVAIRFVPALASGLLVWLAGRLAREFGGGRRAAWTSALAVLASPLFLRAGAMLQPVVLDQLWWTLALFALARISATLPDARARYRAQDPAHGRVQHQWWIALGVALGLGLLTKFSIVFCGIGVVAAIAASPLRRALLTRWPWIALLVALLIGSPSVVGQITLGYPVLGQMHDLQGSQLQRMSAAQFIVGQLLLGPAVALACIGAGALLFATRLRPYQSVGLACVTSFMLLMLLHGKAYYIGPVYPALFAAGAAAMAPSRERAVRSARVPWPRRALLWLTVAIALYGIVTLPFGLPILPPDRMAQFAARAGPRSSVETNTGAIGELPQDYADMLGWREQTEAVSRAFDALPRDVQQRVALVSGNYGEAGGLDFYGLGAGLPAVVSPTGSFWFFGPGERTGDPTLVLTGASHEPELRQLFAQVRIVERVRTDAQRWLVPEERDAVVFLCEGPKGTLQELWPSMAGRN